MPLYTQEEIGKHLGLVVPKEEAHLFVEKIDSGIPHRTGYGCQIYREEYSLEKFFREKKIPLKVVREKVGPVAEMKHRIQECVERGDDILTVFHRKGFGEEQKDTGHALLIAGVEDQDVWVIDPSPEAKKEYKLDLGQLLEAMSSRYDGMERDFWIISGE